MALSINIQELLEQRVVESTRIEYKTGLNPAAVIRTLCAFANDIDNTGGGYIVIGRVVTLDRIVFYTRADFPHNAWWKSAEVEFSDGSLETFALEKKNGPQSFSIEPRNVSSLVLKNLIKSDDPSPFPALVQLMVYGK